MNYHFLAFKYDTYSYLSMVFAKTIFSFKCVTCQSWVISHSMRLHFISKSILILSTDVPDAPSKPRISNVLATSATVSWAPPASDGGSPVTSYIIEKREDGRGRWTKCNKFDVDDTNFKVTDLNEGHEYEFRVSAVNKAGTGKPSATSETIKAKPPYGKLTLLQFLFMIFRKSFL